MCWGVGDLVGICLFYRNKIPRFELRARTMQCHAKRMASQMLQCNASTPTRTREYGSTAEGRVWIACAMERKPRQSVEKYDGQTGQTDFAGWLDGWDRTAPAAWPLSLQACFTVNPPNCIYFKNLSSFYQCPLLLGKEQSHKLVGRIDRYVHNHRTILRLL